MLYIIPFLISFLQGSFLLSLILKNNKPNMIWILSVSFLLGLGISAQLSFFSLLFYGAWNTTFVITINTFVTLFLGGLSLKQNPQFFHSFEIDKKEIFITLSLFILTIPTIVHASHFLYGGWDAWSCWNTKARFIFLGGTSWTGLFDPVMWRSNISYPLLLPLLNVWIWCFGNTPTPITPLIVSCLITFLSASILFSSLKELTKKNICVLAPALLLTSSFWIKLASSQYADLLLGVFFLIALTSFLLYFKNKAPGFLSIILISLGFLSFTKTEGTVLSAICMIVFTIALMREESCFFKKYGLRHLLIAFASFFVTALFFIFFKENGHTFINGLTTPDTSSTFDRLAITAVFFGREFIDFKWNGLWIICGTGLLFSDRKNIRHGLWTIPAILLIYLSAVIGIYWINTFFEIIWWVASTLNRILHALTPVVLLWLFLAILKTPEKQ